ncbi:hypothetical protein [Pseudothauera rhizosphaerae]|uniref:hypothetical protein n=1 Tax=Pseudothauera rhizosphaerae TaxID=2565932 RepID=UPI001454C3C9|nr:hypothetical protein [Pseudothauera rhizosphaerae]
MGELLLVDALQRAKRIHDEGAGTLFDAPAPHAAGFTAAPGNPLLLFLPVQPLQ